MPILNSYPSDLCIYLNTRCNLSCFFCLYHNRSKPTRDFEIQNLSLLNNAIARAKVVSLSAWGEPLLSPHLSPTLQHIYSLNAKEKLIAFVTNGTCLTPDLAHLLTGHLVDVQISLNAATAETYSRDTTGSFSSTLSSIETFLSTLTPSDRKKVGLHFVAHTENYHEINSFIELTASLHITQARIDQFMAPSPELMHHTLLRIKTEYNTEIYRAERTARHFHIQFTARTFGTERKTRKCSSPTTECHVWADGRIAPCCYNGSAFMGNIHNSPLESIWLSPAYQQLRKSGIKQCLSCPKILPFDDPRTHIYPLLLEV